MLLPPAVVSGWSSRRNPSPLPGAGMPGRTIGGPPRDFFRAILRGGAFFFALTGFGFAAGFRVDFDFGFALAFAAFLAFALAGDFFDAFRVAIMFLNRT